MIISSTKRPTLNAGALTHAMGAPLTLVINGLCCIAGAICFATRLKSIRELIHPVYIDIKEFCPLRRPKRMSEPARSDRKIVPPLNSIVSPGHFVTEPLPFRLLGYDGREDRRLLTEEFQQKPIGHYMQQETKV